ncbi:MAG: lantibiotic dehydratase family protein [Verrucomicrobiota bacterium]|nr:lantibiotic dehydratase family protein [Verrucomicrobiota bacterium]
MSEYALAPLFVIRAAGCGFEHLDRLATRGSSEAARALLACERELSERRRAVEELLRFRGHGLSEEVFQRWRKALRTNVAPPTAAQSDLRLEAYSRAAAEVAAAEAHLTEIFDVEFESARRELFRSAQLVLPAYLVFAGAGAQELRGLLRDREAGGVLPRRNAKGGERERHVFLYLQRVCAKNDTFSAFGPSAWGSIENASAEESPFSIRSSERISQVYLERWTAHAIAAAMNCDLEVRPELAPRPHPNHPTEALRFDVQTAAIFVRCNGATPAFELTDDFALLDQLAATGAISWEVEVPALAPDPVRIILQDIRRWRDTPVRSRWLANLEPLSELCATLGDESDPERRSEIIAEVHDRLAKLGYERKDSQRFLYAATNPIGEEVSRRDALRISSDLTEPLARDIEPWVDLWRDTYAFVASRVAAGLRRLLDTAPVDSGAIALPLFLKHCAEQKMSLQHHGIVALAVMAFQEVKRAFHEQIGERAHLGELQLTAEDCHFVRRVFEFPRFDEYTYPSADLQISASSPEAIARGEFEWIVSELHPPVAMLHHCFYWNCPDAERFTSALASTTHGQPNFHFGFFAADFTSHTAVRIFDGLPQQTFFVAPERGDPRWQTVAPVDAEVYVDETSGDVCLRRRGSHQFLGSFARSWLIPLGFHPFNFTRAPHTPRLRCGNAIVQRRSWTVTVEEMRSARETGVSKAHIVATEELRAARELPRFVYIRPTEQALRRSGAEGRDKDTKPVFIDFESYLSIEIFQRWLNKAGELDVTEMLPDPDHLCWAEEDGRHTFELRTLIVPRS